MPDNDDIKKDIVSSIFDRKSDKKEISSLFRNVPQPVAPEPVVLPIAKKALSKSPVRGWCVRQPFGVDIGVDTIKIVQLGKYIGSPEHSVVVSLLKKIPRQQKDLVYGPDNPLVAQLKKIRQEYNLGRDCHVTIPWNMVKVNYMTLPHMPAEEVNQAVTWELKRMYSDHFLELVWDYSQIDSRKVDYLDKQMGIFAVTTAAEEAKRYLSTFTAAGFNPLSFEPDIFAHAFVLSRRLEGGKSPLSVAIDFGASKTLINIFYRGELAFTRYLSFSGEAMTKAIAMYCNAQWEEAEQMKIEHGLSSLSPEGPAQPLSVAVKVKNAILPMVEDVVQDIEQTVQYYALQIAKMSVVLPEQFFVSGGTAQLKGFSGLLQKRLNAQVVDQGALVVAMDLLHKDPAAVRDPASMQTAYGLALRALERG